MYKKIVLVLILFSMSLIAKEKEIISVSFLKDISDRFEKACELKENGKSVKADRLLKEIDKEMTNYLSKMKFFYLDASCPLVWYKDNPNGSLKCLPQVTITWAFGDRIDKKVLEKMEDFAEDKDSSSLITGRFKILYEGGLYHGVGFGCSSASSALKENQEISIYAVPISVSK